MGGTLKLGDEVMENNMKASYQSMDLGSAQPTGIALETVHVEIDPKDILGNYARAFVHECYRNNPELVDRISLTEDEIMDYSKYILYQRVLCVKQTCKDYRKLKSLWIPTWVQYAISMVGEVVAYDQGLKFLPDMKKPEMTFEQAYEVSERIGYFKDFVQLVRDAMPRSIEGDKDVMSTAVIANYVRAQHKVEHVSSTYVTAFLNMKLQEEMAMQAIYRIQYDDVEFIKAALTSFGGIV